MYLAENWKDYELLDTSDGERLERWGKYILIRPDPQVIWKGKRAHKLWNKADGIYRRSKSGGGAWIKNDVPEKWTINYNGMTFNLKPMGFKHTGLFPEQAANWDWFSELIKERKKEGKETKVLNLFAYTGGATAAAAKAGASVVHVDASKGMVQCAKENLASSGLENAPVRYIVDDCRKFVEREIRRGNKYDGIIMDPPSYGRGPGGEVWKLEDAVCDFVSLCEKILSDDPLFMLINSYTTGLSALTMGYVLNVEIVSKHGGRAETAELALPVTETKGFLPCGASARWVADKK
ncbi:MAG: SAM-dependent methyltransferase [Ruminococcaceae bacterium]|nr:SAM-dependent methyltransferase [Oscillospiraceae bacterium]